MTEKRMCYYVPATAYVEGKGFRASVVVEGQPGHHPTGVWPYDVKHPLPYFWGHDYDKACEIATEMNKRMGLSKEDENHIIASSMGAQVRRERRSRLKGLDLEQEDSAKLRELEEDEGLA